MGRISIFYLELDVWPEQQLEWVDNSHGDELLGEGNVWIKFKGPFCDPNMLLFMT